MTHQRSPQLKIVAFGDSITMWPDPMPWTDILDERLGVRFQGSKPLFINAGVGGDTSREGVERMDRDVLAHAPDIVLVEFGGNDATDDPKRFVPVVEFLANLGHIRAVLQRIGAEMVILTFPPIINADHLWGGRRQYCKAGGPDQFVEHYRKAARGFATRHGLVLADIDAVIRANSAANILPDGVHLTGDGIRSVADVLSPILITLVEARMDS